jgi:AraC-like DNA-binding protein
MNIDQNFLFLLSAIGVFNGVILAGYYFFAQPRKLSNFFLGMMLLMLCIRIWKSIFFYFIPSLPRVYLQIGLSAYFFVGPFLYFYVLESTSSKEPWLKWQLHLVLLVGVVGMLSLFYPYQDYPEVWSIFMRFIQYQWLLYILAAVFSARENLRSIVTNTDKMSQDQVLLLSILGGSFLIWLAHFSAPYTSYIAGSLSFSFVFYLFGVVLFFKRQTSTSHLKYSDKKIPDEQAHQLIEKLQKITLTEAQFRNPNLSMPLLARQLGISSQTLSQLLNDNLQKSFSHYLNEIRINAAKEKLLQTKPMKMDDIANECGFNSQSTFYAAFKKQTGTTPAKFREQNLSLAADIPKTDVPFESGFIDSESGNMKC